MYVKQRLLINKCFSNKSSLHTTDLSSADSLLNLHNSASTKIPIIYKLINNYLHILNKKQININSNNSRYAQIICR